MPAARSRTENWRRSLQRIAERGGALEISLPRTQYGTAGPSTERPGGDVIWRVRLLDFDDNEILVERPTAMGAPIPLTDGVHLIGVMTVGQNRWMFHTRMISDAGRIGGPRGGDAVRLEMPDNVERCTRRSFYRISTAGLILPEVEVRPLLNEASAVPAEIAVRERIESMMRDEVAGFVGGADEPLVMPEVGPPSSAKLLNVGGGGVGLMLTQDAATGLESRRRHWMMIHLTPHIPAPLGVAAKLAHTRIDSEQRVYAGFAFEFDHNPAYRKFVVDILCAYSMLVQKEQFQNRALAE